MTPTALRARIVLAELETLGITVEDLLEVRSGGSASTVTATWAPTVAAYVDVVREGYEARSRRTSTNTGRVVSFSSSTL
jgi:hypothetical protein